jgi:hypothetical protein
LGNYEQGTYVPRDISLERLATALGVEPGYLRYGSPVVTSQAWIPNIPANARRKRETIESILKSLPEFISENRFDCVITRSLGDDGRLYYFGRNNDYSCILLANAELADSALRIIKRIISTEELLENSEITIATFSGKDIYNEAKNLGNKGWRFDVEGISRSLWKRKEAVNKISKDALDLVLEALVHITREYDIPYEAVSSLREYAVMKYNELAPVEFKHEGGSRLLIDLRHKIESLGGIRRELKK